MVIKMTMMAITTISSSKVNPRRPPHALRVRRPAELETLSRIATEFSFGETAGIIPLPV
jgi:hypothetical protein